MEMIFQALQSGLSRLKFNSLRSKIVKIPEFNLEMVLLKTILIDEIGDDQLVNVLISSFLSILSRSLSNDTFQGF